MVLQIFKFVHHNKVAPTLRDQVQAIYSEFTRLKNYLNLQLNSNFSESFGAVDQSLSSLIDSVKDTPILCYKNLLNILSEAQQKELSVLLSAMPRFWHEYLTLREHFLQSPLLEGSERFVTIFSEIDKSYGNLRKVTAYFVLCRESMANILWCEARDFCHVLYAEYLFRLVKCELDDIADAKRNGCEGNASLSARLSNVINQLAILINNYHIEAGFFVVNLFLRGWIVVKDIHLMDFQSNVFEGRALLNEISRGVWRKGMRDTAIVLQLSELYHSICAGSGDVRAIIYWVGVVCRQGANEGYAYLKNLYANGITVAGQIHLAPGSDIIALQLHSSGIQLPYVSSALFQPPRQFPPADNTSFDLDELEKAPVPRPFVSPS